MKHYLECISMQLLELMEFGQTFGVGLIGAKKYIEFIMSDFLSVYGRCEIFFVLYCKKNF